MAPWALRPEGGISPTLSERAAFTPHQRGDGPAWPRVVPKGLGGWSALGGAPGNGCRDLPPVPFVLLMALPRNARSIDFG
ncbi:predicted protein [Streptomyces viridosporus ATCC 14672]|uniref:Predicted protein n=1 Tax=Streptomyces viridosporus (strain ATCC 14672 / DSM 40746 / JCM 4963 / KCTC 9882 / NRRL B-12104 / FH 1290) TaxID=566461 RepID=D6A7Y2_STRV1|nr:predicted protein [Streptomyces viridosporus ATCC 14672]